MSVSFRTLIISCVTAALICVQAAAQTDSVRQSEYAHPFGQDSFAPSQARAEFQGFLAPGDFPPASFCQECHEEIHKQWRQSAHSNSFRAPFYLKNVQLLIDGKGIEYTRHCESCHNPIALFTGALTTGSKINRSFDEDGITCSVCHSIVRLQGTTGTGSYVMGKPAVMMNSDGSPREGIPPEQDILDHPELHSKAVMRDFYRTPEFCAVCHKAAIPQQLNGYKWLRAFSVYDEWQQSSWSTQSPLPFYRKDQPSDCRGCHMMPVESKDAHPTKDGKVASHRFPGANTAIPFFYSYPEQLEATRSFLSNTLALDFFALSRKRQGVTEDFALLGPQAVSVKPGDEVTVELVIQNHKIGHGLVPEQRDFYECWVEFTAQDEAGHTLMHSGSLDKRGFLDPRTHSYSNRLIDSSGRRLEQHQVWQTRLKPYDNTIMPGRSDLVRYRFNIPANIRGPVKLAARVNYRRFRKQYSDFILDASINYPVVEMGSAAFTIPVGRDMPAADELPQRKLLRWNNYGIALLGRQQWWKASDAFAQTTRIDPAYANALGANEDLAELFGLDMAQSTDAGPAIPDTAAAKAKRATAKKKAGKSKMNKKKKTAAVRKAEFLAEFKKATRLRVSQRRSMAK